MSQKAFCARRERKILRIIGTQEMSTRDIAIKLETDSSSAGIILRKMEIKGMVTSETRERIYWRIK